MRRIEKNPYMGLEIKNPIWKEIEEIKPEKSKKKSTKKSKKEN